MTRVEPCAGRKSPVTVPLAAGLPPLLALTLALAALPWRDAQAQVIAPSTSPWVSFGRTMALQGYTGLMNIPTADITPYGNLELGINSHADPRLSATFQRDLNYVLSFGLLPFLEIGGRLAEMPSSTLHPVFGNIGVRDLSGNVKVQIPHLFQPDTQIAFGLADLGGGAPFFRSSYGVLTQVLGPFKLTGGYGRGPDRLKGVFAGADVHLRDGFYLTAEKEAAGYSAGARWFSPQIPLLNDGRVVLSAHVPLTTAAIFPKRHAEFAATLQIPLSGKYTMRAPDAPKQAAAWQTGSSALDGPQVLTASLAPEVMSAGTGSSTGSSTGTGTSTVLASTWRGAVGTAMQVGGSSEAGFGAATQSDADPSTALPELAQAGSATTDAGSMAAVRSALLEQGFAGVRLGRSGAGGSTLVVTYQNYRYNINETDALGLVLGHAVMHAPAAVARVAVFTYREGLPVAVTEVSVASFRAWLQGGNKQSAMTELNSRPAGDGPADDVVWDGEVEQNAPRLRLRVVPKMALFVGNEVGLFNYSLGLGIQGNMPLWKGGVVSAETVLPLHDSEQFQRGKAFYSSRLRDGVQNLNFNQAFWLRKDIINLTSVGRFQYDYNGITNDTFWLSPTGTHGLEARVGTYQALKASGLKDSTFGVGTYQYYYWPMDVVLRGSYGKYLAGDYGVTFEARHRFGDVEVSLFYKQTTVKVGGVVLSIPLTKRQEMKASTFIFQGPDRWATGLQTSIFSAGQGNPLFNNVAIFPNTDYNLPRAYLNYGRLNQTYLLRNFDRLKDAYWRFRGQ